MPRDLGINAQFNAKGLTNLTKGIADFSKHAADSTSKVKTLGQSMAAIGGTIFGLTGGIGELNKTLTDYSSKMFNLSRLSNVAGQSFKNIDASMKLVNKTTLLSRTETAKFFTDFNRGILGMRYAPTVVASFAQALSREFGPSIEAVTEATQQLMSVQQSSVHIMDMVRSSMDPAYLEKHARSLLLLGKINIQQYETIMRANKGFREQGKELTDSEKKYRRQMEATQKLNQVMQDLKLDWAEKLGDMLPKISNFISGIVDYFKSIPKPILELLLKIAVAGAGLSVLGKVTGGIARMGGGVLGMLGGVAGRGGGPAGGAPGISPGAGKQGLVSRLTGMFTGAASKASPVPVEVVNLPSGMGATGPLGQPGSLMTNIPGRGAVLQPTGAGLPAHVGAGGPTASVIKKGWMNLSTIGPTLTNMSKGISSLGSKAFSALGAVGGKLGSPIGLAASFGAQALGGSLKEAGYQKTGSALSAAGGIAGSVGTGAMIGSVVPVIGTALGALAGGIYGAISNFDELTSIFGEGGNEFNKWVKATKMAENAAKELSDEFGISKQAVMDQATVWGSFTASFESWWSGATKEQVIGERAKGADPRFQQMSNKMFEKGFEQLSTNQKSIVENVMRERQKYAKKYGSEAGTSEGAGQFIMAEKIAERMGEINKEFYGKQISTKEGKEKLARQIKEGKLDSAGETVKLKALESMREDSGAVTKELDEAYKKIGLSEEEAKGLKNHFNDLANSADSTAHVQNQLVLSAKQYAEYVSIANQAHEKIADNMMKYQDLPEKAVAEYEKIITNLDNQISRDQMIYDLTKKHIGNLQTEEQQRKAIEEYVSKGYSKAEATAIIQGGEGPQLALMAQLEGKIAENQGKRYETTLKEGRVQDERVSVLDSQLGVLESQNRLAQSTYLGAVNLLDNISQQVQVLEEQKSLMQKNIEITKSKLAADKGNPALQKQLAEQYRKQTEYQTKQVELTKNMREGYLDALGAFTNVSGSFAKIILTKEAGMGQLAREFKAAQGMRAGWVGQGAGKESMGWKQGAGGNPALKFRTPEQMQGLLEESGTFKGQEYMEALLKTGFVSQAALPEDVKGVVTGVEGEEIQKRGRAGIGMSGGKRAAAPGGVESVTREPATPTGARGEAGGRGEPGGAGAAIIQAPKAESTLVEIRDILRSGLDIKSMKPGETTNKPKTASETETNNSLKNIEQNSEKQVSSNEKQAKIQEEQLSAINRDAVENKSDSTKQEDRAKQYESLAKKAFDTEQKNLDALNKWLSKTDPMKGVRTQSLIGKKGSMTAPKAAVKPALPSWWKEPGTEPDDAGASEFEAEMDKAEKGGIYYEGAGPKRNLAASGIRDEATLERMDEEAREETGRKFKTTDLDEVGARRADETAADYNKRMKRLSGRRGESTSDFLERLEMKNREDQIEAGVRKEGGGWTEGKLSVQQDMLKRKSEDDQKRIKELERQQELDMVNRGTPKWMRDLWKSHATGGFIGGPDTGHDDRLISVRGGEYVVRPEAVRQPGMAEHLSAINAGVEGYAAGGFVPSGSMAGGSGGGVSAGGIKISVRGDSVNSIVGSVAKQLNNHLTNLMSPTNGPGGRYYELSQSG